MTAGGHSQNLSGSPSPKSKSQSASQGTTTSSKTERNRSKALEWLSAKTRGPKGPTVQTSSFTSMPPTSSPDRIAPKTQSDDVHRSASSTNLLLHQQQSNDSVRSTGLYRQSSSWSTPRSSSERTASLERSSAASSQDDLSIFDDEQIEQMIYANSDTIVPLDPLQLLMLMRQRRGKKHGSVWWRTESHPWTYSAIKIEYERSMLVNLDHDNMYVLIEDLKGCSVKTLEQSLLGVVIEISTPLSIVFLRAERNYDHNEWLAALLFWQPIKATPIAGSGSSSGGGSGGAGSQGRRTPEVGTSTSATAISSSGSRSARDKDHPNWSLSSSSPIDDGGFPTTSTSTGGFSGPLVSGVSSGQQGGGGTSAGSPTVIKAGRLQVLELSLEESEMSMLSMRSGRTYLLKDASAILKDSGELSIYSQRDSTLMHHLNLHNLRRTDLQLLDQSLYPGLACLAIYMRTGPSNGLDSHIVQIFLSFDDIIDRNVWLVLMQCYATPELYGSPLHNISNAFRVKRDLHIEVLDARSLVPVEQVREKDLDTYCEIVLEGEVRARTARKRGTSKPYWRQQFVLQDIPMVYEHVTLAMKQYRHGKLLPIGNAKMNIRDANALEGEKWYPVVYVSRDGFSKDDTGEIRASFELQETVVLMRSHYQDLIDHLEDFDNNVTQDISAYVQEIDLYVVPIMRIFFTEGKLLDWIKWLVLKETSTSIGLRTKSLESRAQGLSLEETQETMPDQNFNAAAVMLFRGNSVMTKAVEIYMHSTEYEYLRKAIGSVVSEIVSENIYCEVDPAKVKHSDLLRENWNRLLKLARDVWGLIYQSRNECPYTFREMFRFIRSTIQEKYGDSLGDEIKYTSVSRFLFLRFFCLAILNPRQFSLVTVDPKSKAQRTLTLIAKGLQGLANMTKFGRKEQWMEPMNEFLMDNIAKFKDFINIVSTPPPSAAPRYPSFNTVSVVLSRMLPEKREGILVLPYLFDEAFEGSNLVQIWLKTTTKSGLASSVDISAMTPSIRRFHEICLQLETLTEQIVSQAEDWSEQSRDQGLSYSPRQAEKQLRSRSPKSAGGYSTQSAHSDSVEYRSPIGSPSRPSGLSKRVSGMQLGGMLGGLKRRI